MRRNACLWAALFVLMLSLCISNAALSEENACAHEFIEQIFVRAEQITSAVKVPNQGHILYGSIVVYDQCFYCHKQLSDEYTVDSYQEGHAAGVDGTCIYCGYLVVDHNAIRLLYTESGFSIGGTSEFILTITNTTDYTVYGGCSAYYNDGTGSGTPEDMFSGDICYRSNLGTIQTETLTFQPGEQKKLSVNAKIPDAWLDTSRIGFSFSGTYADSNGETHICSVEVRFTHTDDTPPSPPIVWEPDVLSLDVAAKEFAVDGKAVFEVTFANKAEYPVDCWLSVFYWQGYGNAVYNNMFGGDVSQEKAEVLDGLGTDIHGYAGTDKIVLDPGQSETLNVTAEIPSTWSEKSSICFSIGGWYTPDGSDSHFVRTEYVFGNGDIPSVPDESPAPDDQDKFELLEIADSHYKLQNAKSGWYLNAFIDPNSLGTYSSYDGINQIFTLKKSANIQEAYTFYCENIYKAGLTGIAASGTKMQCVDADQAGSFKLLKVNNPADPTGEYAAIAVTINDTYYAVTETSTMMGSARKVALEAYTPGNKAQMWKLTKAKGVDVITGDTPVSVNMQPSTLQYALDGKSSNDLTLSLKLAYPTDLIDIVPNTNGTLTIHAKKAGVAKVTVTTASGVSSDTFTVWSVPCGLSQSILNLAPNASAELEVLKNDTHMKFTCEIEDNSVASIKTQGNKITVTAGSTPNKQTRVIVRYEHAQFTYEMECLIAVAEEAAAWENWIAYWEYKYPDRVDIGNQYIYHYWNHVGVGAYLSDCLNGHILDSITTSPCDPKDNDHRLTATGTIHCNLCEFSVKYFGWQCKGFILSRTFQATGEVLGRDQNWNCKSFNDIRNLKDDVQVGDVLFLREGGGISDHWLLVTKIDRNRIGVLECNVGMNCLIYRGYRDFFGDNHTKVGENENTLYYESQKGALPTLQCELAHRGLPILRYRYNGNLKPLPVDSINKGSATYSITSSEDIGERLKLTCNGSVNQFVRLLADGTEMNAKEYSLNTNGSDTVISIKKGSLTSNRPSIRLEYNDGFALGIIECQNGMYQIISGNNGIYVKGYSSALEIICNGLFENFIRALVDGKELDTKDYDVARGSTIITLKPEYLSTLEPGEHTLTFEFTTGSANGTFYIEAPQIITVQPADQEVTEGQTATFAVEAEGENLSYQWYINRQDGKGWMAIDGANRNQYTTQAVTSEHDGYQYYCAVAGSDGAAYKSDAATLHVLKLQALPDTGDHSMILPGLVSILLAALSLMYIRRYRRA